MPQRENFTEMRSGAGDSESGERLRAILETAVDAIVTIEESGVIESVNPAAERAFGYSRDELLGRNVSMLMPSPYREEHDRHVERYLRTGEARIIGIGREVEAQRKDGTVFPVDIAVSEVRLPGRRLFTGIIRDLTERREMEERARLRLESAAHTARMLELGEMCSEIVHEVNQPLTAIVSYAEACLRTVRRGGAQPALIEDALDRVTEQVSMRRRSSRGCAAWCERTKAGAKPSISGKRSRRRSCSSTMSGGGGVSGSRSAAQPDCPRSTRIACRSSRSC